MAILKNIEIHWPQLDKPESKYNPQNPRWTMQCRTYDKALSKQVKAMGVKVEAEELPDGTEYWRFSLGKNTVSKTTGNKNPPVEVLDGNLQPIPSKSIGNGSIANVRVLEWEDKNKAGVSAGAILMAVQITKLIPYVAKGIDKESFEVTETEIVYEEMPDIDGDVF
jgi:hypothetical protein